MKREAPSAQARRARLQLPPLDLSQRYTLDEAALYLRISMAQLYVDLAARKVEAFKDGRRTFISGRAIAARSTGEPWTPRPHG